MEYRDDDRWLLGMDKEGTWADLTIKQKLCLVLLFALVMATGLVEHDNVSVMQSAVKETGPCPRYNAEGKQLKASLVMETYIKNAPKPHECIYL